MANKGKKKKPTKRPPPRKRTSRKGSREEIVHRREEVVRLRMAGLGYRAIGTRLGVGHMTVKRDLEAIQEETSQRMSKFERDHMLAETCSVYEQIEREAWAQYHSPNTGSAQKARFLDVVRGARGDQVKMLTDLGFLRKAPTEIVHNVTSDIISHWTPDAQDIVALAVVKGMTTPALAPTREVIDVPTPTQTLGEVKPNGASDEEEAA